MLSGGNATFEDFYGLLTGRIGLDAQEAVSFLEAEELLLLDVENQRQGISGVSLDEEMTALLTTQHAYEAMIRVTTTVDEMIVSLITSL